ncbi:MAG: sugar phosphate isomerase/epimerase family protein [Bacillota bacterium]|jgi:sugar phosphate isomerase/epimerase
MKFAFSTLGCPTWEWGDILAAAKDLGYDGIEIRGIGKELYAPKIKFFDAKNISNTKKRLADLGLEIACLTSAAYLFNKENHQQQMKIGYEYIDLAVALGTPYIRVMGDETPQPIRDIDVDFVAENLAALADYAEGKNVTVLLETNGMFADSSLAAELLAYINKPQVGILWDVHHPFRYCLEDPQITYKNIKKYLRYLHMKDSVMENGKTVYKMMGEGDVPNREILQILKKDNFAGYISLEWIKRWEKDLTEPGIVFPQFINYIKSDSK